MAYFLCLVWLCFNTPRSYLVSLSVKCIEVQYFYFQIERSWSRSLRIPSRKVRSKMGNSLEQYRATVGMHFIFLMSRHYQLCMTGKFWSTILMLFYMEAIYLPTLKVVVQNYNLMRFNRLWLTQIYLYQFLYTWIDSASKWCRIESWSRNIYWQCKFGRPK